jgi:hypothetical protein
MALGDIGLFNPSETHYTTPGAYDELLRGEATKRASYLASMDQFYAQLTESTRQFDATLAYQNTALAQQATLTREGFTSAEKIAESNIKSSEKMNTESLALGYKQLASTEMLKDRELDLMASQFNSEFRLKEKYAELAEDYLDEEQRMLSNSGKDTKPTFRDYYDSYSNATEMARAQEAREEEERKKKYYEIS